MKKIILGLSVFMMTLVSAQNYPDYYPNNGYGNSNYYGDEDDQFYFPDDYYYEYPADYYNNDLYRNYYSDYRSSINNVNWNRFFAMHRLSPWQVQQIMMLNDSYTSYSAWNQYYRYNPDRWYYDRFYALQRIMGPGLFVVFQNNYYNGYNPVIYYQNYNRQHYARNIYVVPRYRNVNVNVYRVNRNDYHQGNSRSNIGFQQTSRSGQTQNMYNNRDNGFRNDTNGSVTRSGSNTFKSGTVTPNTSNRNDTAVPRNNTNRREVERPANNSGFRTETVQPERNSRSTAPSSKIEINSGSRNSDAGARSRNSSLRNSG
ncbi:hypothetical protein [Kaistella polysaccharea]|uniref:hypothetical protein n=1 Tax=Kaistella polysaccharea TaxID=2878534 RepID=UPI001CF54643|nr:hypothetical protein [Kaistella polysaccharea]